MLSNTAVLPSRLLQMSPNFKSTDTRSEAMPSNPRIVFNFAILSDIYDGLTVATGKNVVLPAESVKNAGKGNMTGVMTFADGGSLRFTVIIDEADITEGFNVTHLSPGPSDANYTYVFMSYPCGIFDGVEYRFHSRPEEFPDVEANVLINGVSLQEINKKNMSRYSFAEFPGSSVDRHKVPVTILCQGNTVTLLIHTGWLSEYTGGKDFTITVTKGFAFTNNGVRYYVSRDKTFVRSHSAFKEVK